MKIVAQNAAGSPPTAAGRLPAELEALLQSVGSLDSPAELPHLLGEHVHRREESARLKRLNGAEQLPAAALISN